MIRYVGVSPGAQATRDLWRVTLGARFSILDWVSPTPSGPSWSARVEEWRKAVQEDKTLVRATTSPPALSGTEITYPYSARAVVDVTIVAADAGDSVSAVANAMDTVVRGVGVLSVARALGSDPIGRDAALEQAEDDAKKKKSLLDTLSLILLLLVIAALVAAAAYAVRSVR